MINEEGEHQHKMALGNDMVEPWYPQEPFYA